jgi:hypothetical protein
MCLVAKLICAFQRRGWNARQEVLKFIFLGYSEEFKSYWLMGPKIKEIYISIDVVFDEKGDFSPHSTQWLAIGIDPVKIFDDDKGIDDGSNDDDGGDD